jgi:hypothetical protein
MFSIRFCRAATVAFSFSRRAVSLSASSWSRGTMPGPGSNTVIYANASNQSENISSVDMEIYLTVDDTTV